MEKYKLILEHFDKLESINIDSGEILFKYIDNDYIFDTINTSTFFGEHYGVYQQIGKGGNGLLYDAYRNLNLNDEYYYDGSVIKIYKCNNKSIMTRMLLIILNGKKYDYSSCLRIFYNENTLIIVMSKKICDITTLYRLNDIEFDKDELIIQILNEMNKLHKIGYVHLDIKSSNLMCKNIDNYNQITFNDNISLIDFDTIRPINDIVSLPYVYIFVVILIVTTSMYKYT